MTRLARPVPGARLRIDDVLRDLDHLPPAEWQPHHEMAWQILRQRLSEEAATHVLKHCIKAGYDCAQSVDRQSDGIVSHNIQNKVQKCFKRLGNCATRDPAALRKALDQALVPLVCRETIDAEVIGEIIDAATTVFGSFRQYEPARTALNLLVVVGENEKCPELSLDEYAAMPSEVRAEVEAALAELAETVKVNLTAATILKRLASAIGKAQRKRRADEIGPNIVEYVRVCASVWKHYGLKPTRLYVEALGSDGSGGTLGDFHRFTDLILTGLMEPSSKRHRQNRDEMLSRLREAQGQLPADQRGSIGAGLRQQDSQWLVSDHHLKLAQKKAPQTP